LAAIEDPSPLVVAALHRFLLAVLYRALMGPTDIEKAKTLFREGLPGEKIKAYLKKWKGRFYLFDEEYPFSQIPKFKPKIWHAWTVLAAEHNADNAKVLFDHVDVEKAGTIPDAVCARWILATQTFSVSCGKSELSHTGTAPSATAIMVLPLGKNLQDTLLFALVPQNREILSEDLPLWERDTETVKKLEKGPERSPTGWADRYTWRTRSILLSAEENEGVSQLAFASGIKFKDSGTSDPMLGYRLDEKKGRLPLQFRDRGLWRNFDSLLPDQENLGPLIMGNVIKLSNIDPLRFPGSVLVVGQSNEPGKAKIKFWRMEKYVLPQALLGNRNIRSEIQQLLEEAQDAQKSLWFSCSSFARDLLRSKLETQFHEMLRSYTLDRDPDDIEKEWLTAVQSTLNQAWQQHRASVSLGDAWAIRALVKAEGPIRRKINELEKKINPEKEVA
jgi:CRISPR system Cascade subunit CasA